MTKIPNFCKYFFNKNKFNSIQKPYADMKIFLSVKKIILDNF